MPTSPPIITLDIDGVLANTGYIPSKMHTSWEPYAYAKPHDEAKDLINYCVSRRLFEPWLVTARSLFPGAKPLTKAWVRDTFGDVDSDLHNRILFGCARKKPDIPKYVVCNQLRSVLHIDDDWRTFVDYDHKGYYLIPFNCTTIWIDNWKDKSSIPTYAETLTDEKKHHYSTNLQEAFSKLQQLTSTLLERNNH